MPSGLSRVTPPQGLQIDEVWIPGDTIVVIPQWVIHRDERYFVRALEFLPERWLVEKGRLIKDERAFFPFQIGEHCTPFFFSSVLETGLFLLTSAF